MFLLFFGFMYITNCLFCSSSLTLNQNMKKGSSSETIQIQSERAISEILSSLSVGSLMLRQTEQYLNSSSVYSSFLIAGLIKHATLTLETSPNSLHSGFIAACVTKPRAGFTLVIHTLSRHAKCHRTFS